LSKLEKLLNGTKEIMKKNRLIVPVAIIAAGLSLAACGSSKPSSNATTNNSGVESSAQASAGAAAKASSPAATGDSSSASCKALSQVVSASQASVKAQIQSYNGVFSDIAVTGQGCNTIVFTYTFSNAQAAAAAAQGIGSQKSTLQQGFNTTLFPQLKEAGISNPAVLVVWKDPTGKVVSSTPFTATQ
jgi:hypothetical protein